MVKKKLPWMILSVIIAALTIWAVVSQSNSFSLPVLFYSLKNANPVFLTAAFLCMAGYIVSEGLALRCLIFGITGKHTGGTGLVYSSADLYFSAITPSATGGQPASAFFMVRDGVPHAATTVVLLLNLIAYTLSLMITGAAALLIRPFFPVLLDKLSRVLLLIGIVILFGLSIGFFMLLKNSAFVERVLIWMLKLGHRFHLVPRYEHRMSMVKGVMEDYRTCAELAAKKNHVFLKALFWNLVQRICHSLVMVFVYLAMHGPLRYVADIWCVQILATISSNSVPVPGAMGVADYLLIQGLEIIPGLKLEANLELISRSISFYFCVFVCLIITLLALQKGKKTESQDK